ncbi:DUF1254 domain-containing protein [Methylobacterium trifolii]|uniref:Cell envelope protein n=1 Tax=Methylobacterium trifolii TaxID=1003092 RepID=A0ABQ4U9F4_9HYPH|nr:DUF1254 domain-containing protein [Methylobacterium trifolii]GJE62805.1 hypothetical protein MPOCJGCO_4941 [Methylobacterium trifolii]
MTTRRELLGGIAASVYLTALAPAKLSAASHEPGFFAAKDIAEAGLIFGLPIVMNYGEMYEFVVDKSSSQYKAPFNVLKNEANVFTYKDTAVVTPNSDTPYSLLWMDLRAEPMVISVPAIDRRRYYSIQLCDSSTYNYGYIGTRATGTDAGDYMVVGPDWKGETPPGIRKIFRSGATLSIAIFRTQLFGPADLDNLKQVQTGFGAVPLSTYLKQPSPPAAPTVTFPIFTKELAKKNFFEYLDFMLEFIPAAANESDIRAKLASIGVGPGKTFKFQDLPLEAKIEIGLGMKQGQDKVEAALTKAGTVINGWNVSGLFGDSQHFDGDWLMRAAAAQGGIYGNSPEEAMYPFTRTDSSGKTLDGATNNYTITFAADHLPPVDAFWSITMYDGKTQLLIENPIDRYLINTPMMDTLKRDADGALTLYIQNKSPGAEHEANWLPAPAGPIYLVMRLYWPKQSPPSILPVGKGTWQPPGIAVAA